MNKITKIKYMKRYQQNELNDVFTTELSKY